MIWLSNMMSFYVLFNVVNNYHDLMLFFYAKITFKDNDVKIVVPNKESTVLLHICMEWTITYMKLPFYLRKSDVDGAEMEKKRKKVRY